MELCHSRWCQLTTNGIRKIRAELAPTINAAVIFLACLAMSIVATFKVPEGAMLDFPVLTMPAAVASALSFFCAAILIFWKPRLGYCLGLAGGLIVFASLARSESKLAPATTWMLLAVGLNAGQAPPFLVLRVLAIALAATALCCSAIRMLPPGLRVRGRVLCRRTWPAVAVGITISIIWAARDATPYFIPGVPNGEYRRISPYSMSANVGFISSRPESTYFETRDFIP